MDKMELNSCESTGRGDLVTGGIMTRDVGKHFSYKSIVVKNWNRSLKLFCNLCPYTISKFTKQCSEQH